MSKEIENVINVLVERIEQNTREIAEKKRTVNSLCREAGKEAIYPDAELSASGGARVPSIRSSQFYGKTPTVAAREYLDLRGEAVPLDEVLEALLKGGFDFEAQGWNDAMRLKNLGISMGKNSLIFHRLPNGTWGLTKWYPNIKQKKAAAKSNEKASEPVTTEEDQTEDGEEAAKAVNAA